MAFLSRWLSPRRIVLIITAIFLSALLTTRKPFFYESPEITGHVIEAESHRPLAGAVVVVQWEQVAHDRLEGRSSRTFRLAEAVTDGCGSFRVPAWGRTWAGIQWNMDGGSPRALIFKPRYGTTVISNFVLAIGGFP